MATSKRSYEERIPLVLELIEKHEPISYTQIHKKLIDETGVKISKHTLNKCLENLKFMRYINQETKKEQGKPHYYSLSKDGFTWDKDINLKHDVLHLNLKYGDEKEYNSNQQNYINEHITLLTLTLIRELISYSNKSKYKAATDFETFIETKLIPLVKQMTDLVRPPFRMSANTLSVLLYTHSYINSYMWEATRPYVPEKSLDVWDKDDISNIMKEILSEKCIHRLEHEEPNNDNNRNKILIDGTWFPESVETKKDNLIKTYKS